MNENPPATLSPTKISNQPDLIKVNYFRLLEWFWEEVPYMSGYKSEYGSTFLAIVDSINRNADRDIWRETAVDYDRLINKIKCSKRLYYEGLRWLRDNNLLAYSPGHNEHSMARFHIGTTFPLEVQKRTSTSTSTGTSTGKVEVQKRTSSDTSTSTSTAPINKDIPNTYIPNTKQLTDVPSFDDFWQLYAQKLGRFKSEQKWAKLSHQDKLDIMAVLPAYVQATPEGAVPARKNPLTFLTQQAWKDEDIGKSRDPTRPPASANTPVTNRPQPTGSPKGLATINKP